MNVEELHQSDGHERVYRFRDESSGLHALIAIHSTALGPAAGGCRAWTYESEEDALSDVLRLSRGMTYKNAMADLPFGGGKAVLVLDSPASKSEQLMAAFGDCVNTLAGQYVTAEDVGISIDDMEIVRQRTRFVSGLPSETGSAGGDPSPWTALGVFYGIKSAAEFRWGSDDLSGVSVAVQGLGNVGYHLCNLLSVSGAKLHVADINEDRVQSACRQFNAQAVAVGEILFCNTDVVAPCALGAVLNSETIPRLNAQIVAGAANNQLESEDDGDRMADRGILYAPDFVINAGGIISVAREYLGSATDESVREEISRIPDRLKSIFKSSAALGTGTNRVANDRARQIVSAGKAVNSELDPQKIA